MSAGTTGQGALRDDDVDPAPPATTTTTTAAAAAAEPEIVLRTAHACVIHGDDAGEFYCEHAFFSAQLVATEPGSAIARNLEGDALVGFLHVPRDDVTGLPGPTADQAQRHRGTREIVGAALRGFVDDVARADPLGVVRVLLTGYLQWGEVENNPSGDFVAHRDNVDAAMGLGFGRLLVTSEGKAVDDDAGGAVWRYRVRALEGGHREVEIKTRCLSVDDDAIDGGSRSLQGAMRSFLPHAVLSMGVHKGSAWIAEHHADDARLGERDGLPAHDKQAVARTTMPDNFSLARAIQRGADADKNDDDDDDDA
ncbi:MAG: hypothetical protein Q8O67_33700 [Deltaproteobacteria bacterium]|nr:hypothetical protein [Deltaproteobacteria bacterium]